MKQRALSIAIVLSLILHIVVLGGLLIMDHKRLANRPVEITFVETPRPKSESKQPQLKQIVDQNEKSLNDEIPKDAQYLSRNNQRVEKETKAQQHGKFVNSDNGSPNPVNQNQKQNTPPRAQAKNSAERQGPGPKLALKDLKPQLDWSPQAMAQKSGEEASKTDDFIKDAQTGPQTLLNTREFIYYSYYSRIKEKLRQYWEPKIKDKVARLLAQGRTLASSQDRITKMIIILDPRGTLIRVQIIGESGISDLDDAAVEAFRAAAPFPHPPEGIVEADGTIKIRWDFVLEANNTLLRPDRVATADQDGV